MSNRFIVLATGFTLLAHAASAQQRTETRAAASDQAAITISTISADITVIGHDAAEVIVRSRRQRGVEITGERDRIRVRNEDDEDIEVRVPRRARVDIHTTNGDVDISAFNGSIYWESLSGSIRVGDEPRMLELESVSGSIEVLGKVTSARLNTVSGDINVPRAAGTVSASTASGDVTVVAEGLERGELSSTSGTVVLSGSPSSAATLYLDSASGTLELRLGSAFPADYSISTVTGDIENAYGPVPTRFRNNAGQNLRFTTGAGARIRLGNVSGRIRILNR